MTLTLAGFSATVAAIAAIWNLVLYYLRMEKEVRLKKTEMAISLVGFEYERIHRLAPDSEIVYAPSHYLDYFLQAVDDIYENGKLDVREFVKKGIARKEIYDDIEREARTGYIE